MLSTSITKELEQIKRSCVDKEALIILNNAIEKISYYEKIKIASIEKKAFLAEAILKTLQMAAIAVSALLLRSPLKVAVAYNALTKLIKLIEKGVIK